MNIKIPPMLDVTDPSLKQVGYTEGKLFVRYNDGRLIAYPGVSVEQYAAMGNARSLLRFLREAILPGNKGTLIEDADGA